MADGKLLHVWVTVIPGESREIHTVVSVTPGDAEPLTGTLVRNENGELELRVDERGSK